MAIIRTKGVYEFRLANGHLAGTIEYDYTWSVWRFISETQCRLDSGYVRELHEFMRRLR